MTRPPINAEDAFTYCRLIVRDEPTEFRLIHPVTGETRHFWGYPENEDQLGMLADYNAEGYGVYAVVNQLNASVEQRCKRRQAARDQDVTAVRAVFIDFDTGTAEENHAKLAASPLTPSMTVCSGLPAKLHAYWVVADLPLEDFRRAQKALAEHFGSDQKIVNEARVMRLPGFENTKPEYAPNNPVARVLTAPGHVHTRAELFAAFNIPSEPPAPPQRAAATVRPPADDRARRYALAALDREAQALRTATMGNRNDQLNRSAFNLGQLVGGEALDRAVVEGVLRDAAAAAGLAGHEIEGTLRSGIEAGMLEPRGAPERPEREHSRATAAAPAATSEASDLRSAALEVLAEAKRAALEASEADRPEAIKNVWASLITAGASPVAVEDTIRQLASDLGLTLTALRADYRAAEKEAKAAGPMRRKAGGYAIENNVTCLVRERSRPGGDVETDLEPLANFSAHISESSLRDDGVERTREYKVVGLTQAGRELPEVTVPAERFDAMNWPTTEWGGNAVIYAGAGQRDHMRAATHLLSEPTYTTLYTHTGWRNIDGQDIYLHAGGAVGRDDDLPEVQVDLSGDLARYSLPPNPAPAAAAEALRASLGLLDVAPDHIMGPLLAITYRAPIGGADFTGHLSGLTGVRKTQLAALCQQHSGAEMTGDRLPGSWTSTSNALEVLAFGAKDELLTIDDFNPTGARGDIDRYHAIFERLGRAVGNRSGRGRLRPDGTLRPTKPPRCLVLSTGEDIPRGHSLRARLLVLEVKQGDVNLEALTTAQQLAAEGTYATARAGFISWLAADLAAVKQRLQDLHKVERKGLLTTVKHPRTADIGGQLLATWTLLREYAQTIGLSAAELDAAGARIRTGILEALEAQAGHQTAADPVQHFLNLYSALISSGRGHLATTSGEYPGEGYGWRTQETRDGGEAHYPQGARLGWLAEDATGAWLDPETVFAETQRLGEAQGEPLPTTKQTLWARLTEAGHLVPCEEGRSGKRRFTWRRTVEGMQKNLLLLPSIPAKEVYKVYNDPQEADGEGQKPMHTPEKGVYNRCTNAGESVHFPADPTEGTPTVDAGECTLPAGPVHPKNASVQRDLADNPGQDGAMPTLHTLYTPGDIPQDRETKIAHMTPLDLDRRAANLAERYSKLPIETLRIKYQAAHGRATAAPSWWHTTATTEALPVTVALEMLATDQEAGALTGTTNPYLQAARNAVAALKGHAAAPTTLTPPPGAPT